VANPTVRSSSVNSAASDSNPTALLPAGTANGDALYVGIYAGAASAPGMNVAASGWNFLNGQTSGLGSMFVYWKIAASEPANWTWALTGPANWIAQTIAVQNPGNAVTPTDVSGIQPNASSLNIGAPSITTTRANDLLLGFFGIRSGTTITPDGAMTEVQDVASGAVVTLEAAWQAIAGIGATGTRTAVAASNAAASVGWLGAVLAPVGGGGPAVDPFLWSL